MKASLFALVFLVSVSAFATPLKKNSLSPMAENVAPVVPSTGSVTGAQVGQMVFDASSNSFKGLDSLGDWQTMSTTERTARVHFAGSTANTNCSSDPCTIYSGDGSVVTVNHGVTGTYTVHFATGTFSGRPSCMCNGINLSSGVLVCSYDTTSTNTQAHFSGSVPSSGTAADGWYDIICVGPR